MKRLVTALVMGVLIALLAVAPAAAQYGGGGTNPPPPGPPNGCPPANPPPANPPPCNPRRTAQTSDRVVVPGETITVSTPPVFAPGSTPTINIIRIRRGADPSSLGTTTVAADGSVSQTVTIPDLPPGVYFIYLTGVDPAGNTIVARVPIVVRRANQGGGQGRSVQGDSAQPGSALAAPAPVPAAVAEAQLDLTPAAEAAVVESVTSGGAGLVLDGDRLSVRTPSGLQDVRSLPTTGADDISEQVTVGAALLLAGTGLVLLRRRRGGFTK